MQLDGYIRVSDVRGREGDSFISPDQQRDKILAWATVHDHEIVAWEEDFDQSGGKLSRPGFDRIMGRIENGETGGIAIAKLDRFSRAGVGDALALIERIKDRGAVFGCVEPVIDTGEPVMGEFVLTLFLALARMERQRIKVNWADSRRRAIGRGRHLGGVAPFGYRKRPQDGHLEPDPLQAPVLVEIFERRAAGQAWGAITRWLTEQGAVNSRGLPLGNAGILGRIAQNEVYLGVLKDGVTGERIEDAHPPLVDLAVWRAAQHRSPVRYGRNGNNAARLPLSGLCRCATCRYAMTSKTDKYGTTWYSCRQLSSRLCPAPAWIRSTDWKRSSRKNSDRRGLENYVVDEMLKHLSEVKGEAFGSDTDLGELEQAWQNARRELALFAGDVDLQDALGRDGTLARSHALRERVEQTEAVFNEAAREAAVQQPTHLLREDWDAMTLDEQRGLLGQLVQAVFVRPVAETELESRERIERIFELSEAGVTQAEICRQVFDGFDRTKVSRVLKMGREEALRRYVERPKFGRMGGRDQRDSGAELARDVRIVWADEAGVDIPRQGRRSFVQRPFPFDGADNPDEVGEVVGQPAAIPADG